MAIIDAIISWLMRLWRLLQLRPVTPDVSADVEAIRVTTELLYRNTEMIINKQDKLGVQMATVEEVLGDLNDATNEVAAEFDGFASDIQELKDQIAALDPDAAAKLQALMDGVTAGATRLRGLAADPEEPVPPVEEPPADGGGDNIPPLG